MKQLTLLACLISLTMASAFDVEDCEGWYLNSINSKPKYTRILQDYAPNRCTSTNKPNQIKMALNGTISNRLCSVLIDTATYTFIDDKSLNDCFRAFDVEMQAQISSNLIWIKIQA